MSHPEAELQPQPGRRERRRQETWQALRREALRLVGERGFEGVSIDEIAAAAGVAKRTFFNYFMSKEAVLLDPDPQEPAAWQSLLDACPDGQPPWLALRAALLAYTRAYETKLVAYKRMADASPALARSSRDTTHEFWLLVRNWVGRRVRSPFEADLLTACARTVLRTAMDRWRPEAGLRQFHRLIGDGFDRLAAGLVY
jgi:AcrR family transcriptional regulator